MDDDQLDYYKDRELHTASLAHEELIRQRHSDQADDDDNITRLCWNNVKGDDEQCIILTGFSCDEFIELLEICEKHIPIVIGRGKHGQFTTADKLLMILCYIKHYETQEKLGSTFNISKSQVNSLVDDVSDAIMPIFYDKYVVNIDKLTAYQHKLKGEFANAKFVMDATVQEIWTPLGNFNERKRFYSEKHKKYCLKSGTLHLRNGLLVNCWSGYPGSVHDLTVARENIKNIKKFARKPDPDDEDDSWSIMADKGFIGLEEDLNIFRPHKRRAMRKLTVSQKNFNKRLASKRVICERWYGRLKTRYRIMAAKYRNHRDNYERYFKLCAALTNYHMLSNPL